MLQVPLEWKVILYKTVCFTPDSAAKYTQASNVLNCDLKLMFDCQESTTNHLQPSLKTRVPSLSLLITLKVATK